MKSWTASRTVWLNLATLGILTLNHFLGFADFQASPWVAEAFAGLVAFANVYMRFKTTQPIA